MKLDPWRTQRFLRRAVLLVAGLGTIWLVTRVELLRLPASGCSPVMRYAPGSLILLDRRPATLFVGDVLFFEAASEGERSVHLGRLLQVRGPEGREELWIEGERESCPGLDSRALGWIGRERVRARALFALPW